MGYQSGCKTLVLRRVGNMARGSEQWNAPVPTDFMPWPEEDIYYGF
jgi:hypothetical protein